VAPLTGGVTAALTLLLWGTFSLVPWRLRAAPAAAQRWWARLAVPLLLLAIGLVAWTLRLHPDAALTVRVHSWIEGGKIARSALLLVAVLGVATTLLALAWEKLEPTAWALVAAFGLAGWGAVAAVLEMLRMGEGPPNTVMEMVVAVLAHAYLGLAAAEAVAPASRSGRPWLALPGMLAALAVGLYLWALPAPVLGILLRQGAGLTATLTAVLFAAAPWLPLSLRRPALLAGTLLAGLLYGWASDAAASLAGLMQGGVEFL
jgi:hypothetical protein